MNQLNQDNPQLRIVKEIAKIKAELRKTTTVTQLYSVLNENTPAQITSNQNNYDPGYYEVLRMSANAVWNVSGFSGGVKGRTLRIINVGTVAFYLLHNSPLSLAANRMYVSSQSAIYLIRNYWVDLYYDSTIAMWRAMQP